MPVHRLCGFVSREVSSYLFGGGGSIRETCAWDGVRYSAQCTGFVETELSCVEINGFPYRWHSQPACFREKCLPGPGKPEPLATALFEVENSSGNVPKNIELKHFTAGRRALFEEIVTSRRLRSLRPGPPDHLRISAREPAKVLSTTRNTTGERMACESETFDRAPASQN